MLRSSLRVVQRHARRFRRWSLLEHDRGALETRKFSTPSSRSNFGGVYPILVTPFLKNDDELLDLQSFRRSIRFMAEAEVQGVTITGVLGESNRLTDKERQRLIETARTTIQEYSRKDHGIDGRPPLHLCVGTSHTGTAATVALCEMAKDLKADSVMVTPSVSHGVEQLYHRVADACPNLPIVVQDHPLSTGVHLPTDLLVRLVAQVPTVACIKLESLPTVDRLAELRAHPDWNGCPVLTGLGALYAGFDLEHQISGFMTGFSFPEVLRGMHAYAASGDVERSQRLYAKFLPLIVLEHYGGLALRKEIYRLRALSDSAQVRHPGRNLSTTLQQTLRTTLDRLLPGIDLTKPLPSEVLEV